MLYKHFYAATGGFGRRASDEAKGVTREDSAKTMIATKSNFSPFFFFFFAEAPGTNLERKWESLSEF